MPNFVDRLKLGRVQIDKQSVLQKCWSGKWKIWISLEMEMYAIVYYEVDCLSDWTLSESPVSHVRTYGIHFSSSGSM